MGVARFRKAWQNWEVLSRHRCRRETQVSYRLGFGASKTSDVAASKGGLSGRHFKPPPRWALNLRAWTLSMLSKLRWRLDGSRVEWRPQAQSFFTRKLSVSNLSYLHTQATVLRVPSQWSFQHYLACHECSIVWYHSLAIPHFRLAHTIESLKIVWHALDESYLSTPSIKLPKIGSSSYRTPPPHVYIYIHMSWSAVIQNEISRTIIISRIIL